MKFYPPTNSFLTQLIALSTTLTFLLAPATAQQESPEMAKARELMAMMQITEMLNGMEDQMIKFSNSMLDSQELDEATLKAAKASTEESMKITLEEMQKMDFEGMYAEIYAQAFSVEELQGIIDFYKSPAGQKMLEKQPELSSATMEMMQGFMGELMPKVQQRVEEALREAQQAN